MGGKNAIGRPTKLIPDVVGKLTAAFANGFTVEQACQYANIDKTTYYDWLKKNEQFSHDMTAAQGRLGLQARKVVADAVNQGDIQTAKWWLEKRDPEFTSKGELTVTSDPAGELLRKFGLIEEEPDVGEITPAEGNPS